MEQVKELRRKIVFLRIFVLVPLNVILVKGYITGEKQNDLTFDLP